MGDYRRELGSRAPTAGWDSSASKPLRVEGGGSGFQASIKNHGLQAPPDSQRFAADTDTARLAATNTTPTAQMQPNEPLWNRRDSPDKAPQSYKDRFVVKSHRPEAPDDQKRLVESLQQSVILSVNLIVSTLSTRQLRSGGGGGGGGSFGYSYAGRGGGVDPGGPQDREIHTIRTNILEEITRTFREANGAQNEQMCKVKGLLTEACRKVEMLEKVIQDQGGKPSEQEIGKDSSSAAAGSETKTIEVRVPPTTTTTIVSSVSKNTTQQAATAAASEVADSGGMLLVKALGTGPELAAVSKPTMISHLKIVSDILQRVGDMEQEVMDAQRAAAAAEARSSELERALQDQADHFTQQQKQQEEERQKEQQQAVDEAAHALRSQQEPQQHAGGRGGGGGGGNVSDDTSEIQQQQPEEEQQQQQLRSSSALQQRAAMGGERQDAALTGRDGLAATVGSQRASMRSKPASTKNRARRSTRKHGDVDDSRGAPSASAAAAPAAAAGRAPPSTTTKHRAGHASKEVMHKYGGTKGTRGGRAEAAPPAESASGWGPPGGYDQNHPPFDATSWA